MLCNFFADINVFFFNTGFVGDYDSESSSSLFEVESDGIFDRENLRDELEMEMGIPGLYLS